jgi:hypothetical protein
VRPLRAPVPPAAEARAGRRLSTAHRAHEHRAKRQEEHHDERPDSAGRVPKGERRAEREFGGGPLIATARTRRSLRASTRGIGSCRSAPGNKSPPPAWPVRRTRGPGSGTPARGARGRRCPRPRYPSGPSGPFGTAHSAPRSSAQYGSIRGACVIEDDGQVLSWLLRGARRELGDDNYRALQRGFSADTANPQPTRWTSRCWGVVQRILIRLLLYHACQQGRFRRVASHRIRASIRAAE